MKLSQAPTPMERQNMRFKKKSHKQDEAPKEHLRWDYILLLLEFAFAYYLLDMKMWHGIPAEGKRWVE